MGRFDIKSEEKAPSDANKRGNGFDGGKNVRREDFAATIKALNALQVKFDCGEGNQGGEFLGVSTADNGMPEHEARRRRRRQIVNSERDSIRARMAGPGRTEPSGHEGHATGERRDQSEEGGEAAHLPEH